MSALRWGLFNAHRMSPPGRPVSNLKCPTSRSLPCSAPHKPTPPVPFSHMVPQGPVALLTWHTLSPSPTQGGGWDLLFHLRAGVHLFLCVLTTSAALDSMFTEPRGQSHPLLVKPFTASRSQGYLNTEKGKKRRWMHRSYERVAERSLSKSQSQEEQSRWGCELRFACILLERKAR